MNAQTSQCIPCPSVPTIHGIKSATQSAWDKKWPVKKAIFSIIFVEKFVIFFSDFWSFLVDVAFLRGVSFCNVSLFYWCVWFFYVAPKTYLRVFQGCPRKFKRAHCFRLTNQTTTQKFSARAFCGFRRFELKMLYFKFELKTVQSPQGHVHASWKLVSKHEVPRILCQEKNVLNFLQIFHHSRKPLGTLWMVFSGLLVSGYPPALALLLISVRWHYRTLNDSWR